MIRLYGPYVGNHSYHRITRGMRDALSRAGALAGFFPTDVEFGEDLPPGAMAPVGVMTGMANAAMTMRLRGLHAERLTMIAPNSSWLPPDMVRFVSEHCTGLLSPSRWGAAVLRAHCDLPVEVWQHGVDEGFAPDQAATLARVEDYGREGFTVGHLSSTTRSRKATQQVIEAWLEFVRLQPHLASPKLKLIVPAECVEEMLWMAQDGARGDEGLAASVDVAPSMNLTAAQAAAWYSSLHVLCQPSRGEGFGITPLEARACGVPVVATECTGQSEGHVRGRGVVIVPHGADSPIDDGDGAMAPSVSTEAVLDGLTAAYEQWPRLSHAAMGAAASVQKEWSWDAVTSRWLGQRKGKTDEREHREVAASV